MIIFYLHVLYWFHASKYHAYFSQFDIVFIRDIIYRPHSPSKWRHSVYVTIFVCSRFICCDRFIWLCMYCMAHGFVMTCLLQQRDYCNYYYILLLESVVGLVRFCDLGIPTLPVGAIRDNVMPRFCFILLYIWHDHDVLSSWASMTCIFVRIKIQLAETESFRFNIVIIMVADALASCFTRTSATVILIG